MPNNLAFLTRLLSQASYWRKLYMVCLSILAGCKVASLQLFNHCFCRLSLRLVLFWPWENYAKKKSKLLTMSCSWSIEVGHCTNLAEGLLSFGRNFSILRQRKTSLLHLFLQISNRIAYCRGITSAETSREIAQVWTGVAQISRTVRYLARMFCRGTASDFCKHGLSGFVLRVFFGSPRFTDCKSAAVDGNGKWRSAKRLGIYGDWFASLLKVFLQCGHRHFALIRYLTRKWRWSVRCARNWHTVQARS